VRNVHGRTISGPCVCVYVSSMYRVERSDSRENSGARIFRFDRVQMAARRKPSTWVKIDMSFQRNDTHLHEKHLNAYRQVEEIESGIEEKENRLSPSSRIFASSRMRSSRLERLWNLTVLPFGETSFACSRGRQEPVPTVGTKHQQDRRDFWRRGEARRRALHNSCRYASSVVPRDATRRINE